MTAILATGPVPAPMPSVASQSAAKTHTAAKQFEAMFMGEMLRLARPPNGAAGVFAEGQAEKSWNIMMDQALGQAAAQGDTPLGAEIEQAMQAAQASHAKGKD